VPNSHSKGVKAKDSKRGSIQEKQGKKNRGGLPLGFKSSWNESEPRELHDMMRKFISNILRRRSVRDGLQPSQTEKRGAALTRVFGGRR